jgi:hypothetical protein
MQNYNFACGSVWVWNLVSDSKGGTMTAGVWEQGAEEIIWTKEELNCRRFEKIAKLWARNLYSLPIIIRMIKSRSMRWAGHLTQMGVEEECIYNMYNTLAQLTSECF